MKISSLKPGDIVWSVLRLNMGNTTIKSIGVFSVKVCEVHENYVIASWNGNPREKFRERTISKWRRNKPVTIRLMTGNYRLATREEIKSMKEAETS
ncbi:hypothetical protein R9X49_06365 [Pectobacterium carotovorum]|uniref:hypothetical protein n=1 Tax=Pectobacterium carotovorum TaxID=554 RepID=UPI0029D62897|nr:hypothetical protein [Pectobacterium carotovorum]MDX6914729.1 hypothetical protein [Pectobacterium carotovorum]